MKPSSSLLVLIAVNVLNIYDRQALGALAEPVRREFNLSDTQLGALSTSFTLLYAVAGLPLGRLADRGSRRRLLALGVTVWSALTAAGGAAASYLMLLVSRLGVALGEAVCAPAATSWIGDLYPPAKRARPLALYMLGVPLGSLASLSLSGPLGQAFGWRAALLLAGAPALVLVPALLALREPDRGAAEGRPAAPGSAWALLRLPAFRWIVVSGALVNFVLYAIGAFLPAFLMRYHGWSLAQSGFWLGVGLGAGGIVGGLVAGYVGDRWRRQRLMGAAAAAAVAAPFGLAGLAQAPGAGLAAVLLLTTAYGLLQMYYGLVYAAIQDVVGPGLRGAAMALYFLAMYLCGGSFGPLLTGRLSDALARAAAGAGPLTEAARAAGLHQAMYLIPVLSLALAGALYAGGCAMRGVNWSTS